MNIEKIDKNFICPSLTDVDDVEWYDVRKAPFKIYGLYKPEQEPKFHRLPEDVYKKCNDGVRALQGHTAGGRVRFKTDSPYIAIKAFYPGLFKMTNMAISGSSGFDIYYQKNGKFVFFSAPRPTYNDENEYAAKINLSGDLTDIVISFPLYNYLNEFYVGVKKGCVLTEGEKYEIEKPLVFYGSSITQGACASRPSNCYEALISQKFNADFINLGFSGSAQGEEAMADYIRSLEMSVFILDYDYNAPTLEHLEATHLPFYKRFRAAQPETPVIMVSRPSPIDKRRREVIKKTYEYAVNNGDKRVAFIDGDTLFDGDFKTSCTADGCHPNDLGFYRMANVIGAEIEKFIK